VSDRQSPVATAGPGYIHYCSRSDLGFLLKICFFDSGQILEMSVVLLYFPFTNTAD